MEAYLKPVPKRLTTFTLLALVSVGGALEAQTLSVTDNLVLWLRADALSLTENQGVSSWTDSSPSANHAAQATGTLQPAFHTNVFGGKPIVRFVGQFRSDAVGGALCQLGIRWVVRRISELPFHRVNPLRRTTD